MDKSIAEKPIVLWAICVFLVLATAVVYAQVAWFPFIDLDDGAYVYLNSFVKDPISLKNLGWAFTTYHSANWHPLTWISHMIDCQIYGVGYPGGHHITNVLLHIANAVLLFVILLRLTGSAWRSGFVAALFALHPLHVESVAWVAERKDLLSTLFWMLTILAYLQFATRPNLKRYALVCGLYALGLMAKPMLVTLPLILLLLDWWLYRQYPRENLEFRRLLIEKIPLFVLAAASCLITLLAQLHADAAWTLAALPMGVRLANAAFAYIVYIGKMLWPQSLHAFYSHPGNSLPTWLVMVSGAAFVSATLLAILVRRRLPYVLVGWVWYVVMLIPVIGIVQVGPQAFADRYTYLPLVGLFIIIAWGVPDALSRVSVAIRRTALGVLSAMVILVLSVCTWSQVGVWRNTRTLGNHALKLSRGDNLVRSYVAGSLEHMGKPDEAIELLKKARPDRNIGQVYSTLGGILAHNGRFEEAERYLRRAVRLQPNAASIHCNLGVVLHGLGYPEEALQEYQTAADLDPWYALPHYNMGTLLKSVGRIDEALEEYEKAMRLNPERIDARSSAADILYSLGRQEEALAMAESAVELDPDCAEARYVIGSIYGEQASRALNSGEASLSRARADEALSHLRLAAKQRPEWAPPHDSIAKVLFVKGDYAGAWKEVHKAASLGGPRDPGFIQALSQRMPDPVERKP